jgi:hypothetical protein
LLEAAGKPMGEDPEKPVGCLPLLRTLDVSRYFGFQDCCSWLPF